MNGPTKYSPGEVLIYVGDSHSQFKQGESYKINEVLSVDFEPDTTKPDTFIFFQGQKLGCYVSWAKDNFISVVEFREKKLNKLLRS